MVGATQPPSSSGCRSANIAIKRSRILTTDVIGLGSDSEVRPHSGIKRLSTKPHEK